MTNPQHYRLLVSARKERGPRSGHAVADPSHDERRQELFGGALGTAPEDHVPPLPPKGPARDELAAKVRRLKEELGATHLQVVVQLGMDMGQVALLCRDYGIASATPAKRAGSRRKGYEPVGDDS